MGPDTLYFVIRDEQKTVRFVFVTRDEDEQLDFREDPIPEIELSTLNDEITRLNKEISQIDSVLQDMGSARPVLNDYRAKLQKTLEFNHVAHSMDGQDNIIYLQGYCPEDAVPRIEEMAQKEGVGYVIEDPDTPEDVPTLIRNPKWMRIIEPLFKFMGTLPGYNEQDISLTFLAFFSLFYAMLVGDAGYGFIIVGATYLFSRKNKTAPREGFRLMYLLGFTTILWGLFSGTWFGSEALSQLPILKAFIIDEIYSFSEVNQNILMKITFIIGAVHLSVARLLAAFKKINSPTAIGELGWVAVLWAIYFIANSLVLGKPLPGFVGILFLVGVILIGFFTHFQKNIFKGFLQTLSNLPLDIINTFSDVVSYIRLFAVGLATVIVASSFNEMAIGTGIDSILGGILAVIVLLFGHALNITLAMMSVLVHGVRLNMLEFSGHVGIQWSGKKYTPFKE
jgi:V/A-type H+-transporting ATPase subunit I